MIVLCRGKAVGAIGVVSGSIATGPGFIYFPMRIVSSFVILGFPHGAFFSGLPLFIGGGGGYGHVCDASR